MKTLKAISTILTLSSAFDYAVAKPVDVSPENAGLGLTARDSPSNSGITSSTALQERQNGCGPGEILVYNFPNSTGSWAMLCISKWTFFGCIIISTTGAFSNLANRVADWVTGKVHDASDAGPQVKVRDDTPQLTWGELYNYTLTHDSAKADKALPSALTSADDGVVAMDIHEDGFSASFDLAALSSPNPNPLEKRRDRCYEQIHIHYWAAAGHDGTMLGHDQIFSLAIHAIDDSYWKNYNFACYELTNSGAWDGWLRICYNHNTPQAGCGSCGGHNN